MLPEVGAAMGDNIRLSLSLCCVHLYILYSEHIPVLKDLLSINLTKRLCESAIRTGDSLASARTPHAHSKCQSYQASRATD